MHVHPVGETNRYALCLCVYVRQVIPQSKMAVFVQQKPANEEQATDLFGARPFQVDPFGMGDFSRLASPDSSVSSLVP